MSIIDEYEQDTAKIVSYGNRKKVIIKRKINF